MTKNDVDLRKPAENGTEVRHGGQERTATTAKTNMNKTNAQTIRRTRPLKVVWSEEFSTLHVCKVLAPAARQSD
jgi:hypothetical protein